jgi:hypothetical protein
MKNITLKQYVMVVISSLLIACATPAEPTDSTADEGQSRGRDCISQSTIRDYQVLDESNLIVTASGKRKYHVLLSRRAYGLRSTWQIGFRSPMNSICPGTGELIVGDGFGRVDEVHIASIRELSPDDADELLVRFGKKEPDFEQTPATEEVAGAEVEELD